ncbi:MAG: MgtC/SapB family protein [Planctomycetota bacterium]|nr:MgtC/SapB family protein [Planctomycetota bacterium]
MDTEISTWEGGLRLLLAVLFGAVVGWERERRERPAGLRTHMMVALGAAAFTLIAMEMIGAVHDLEETARFDPIRIIAYVVGGIGFLGAGAIIRTGEEVSGMTTAAGIWVVAGIGIACGVGYYMIALMTAALAFITLTLFRLIEHRIFAHHNEKGDRSEGGG